MAELLKDEFSLQGIVPIAIGRSRNALM